jgi:hypothetical protein
MKRTYALATTALAITWSIGCVDITTPDFKSSNSFPFQRDTTGFIRSGFSWQGWVAPGNQIEIKGVFGDIRAGWTPGNELVVTATKFGRAHDVEALDIEVVRHSGGVTICAVYPDVPGQPPNHCGPGDSGNLTVRDDRGNGPEVEFVVRIPEGVAFAGRTISGDIEAEELRSDADLATVGGDIRVSTTQVATVTTVSGSIDATIGLPDWGRDLKFGTVSGNVVVAIPSNTNAEIRASSLSGTIASDFPLTQASRGDMRGTVGSGGPLLALSALSRDITLKRAY